MFTCSADTSSSRSVQDRHRDWAWHWRVDPPAPLNRQTAASRRVCLRAQSHLCHPGVLVVVPTRSGAQALQPRSRNLFIERSPSSIQLNNRQRSQHENQARHLDTCQNDGIVLHVDGDTHCIVSALTLLCFRRRSHTSSYNGSPSPATWFTTLSLDEERSRLKQYSQTELV